MNKHQYNLVMEIENQLCSIEQSKRLKELRIRNSGQFNWKEFEHKKTKEIKIGWTFGGVGQWESLKSYNIQGNYSAFTCAELGVMLREYCNRISSTNENNYLILEKDLPNASFSAQSTETKARAELLIFLLESKLLSSEDCNKLANG